MFDLKYHSKLAKEDRFHDEYKGNALKCSFKIMHTYII